MPAGLLCISRPRPPNTRARTLVKVGPQDGAEDGGRLHGQHEVPVHDRPVCRQRVALDQVEREVDERAAEDGGVGERHRLVRPEVEHHQKDRDQKEERDNAR